ncbi:MAG TPA: HflK protein, partial [Petrotoga sp.]
MAEYEIFNPNEEFNEEGNNHEGRRWRNIIIIGVIIAIAAYLLTGIYQVGPSEVALVKTFGEY